MALCECPTCHKRSVGRRVFFETWKVFDPDQWLDNGNGESNDPDLPAIPQVNEKGEAVVPGIGGLSESDNVWDEATCRNWDCGWYAPWDDLMWNEDGSLSPEPGAGVETA